MQPAPASAIRTPPFRRISRAAWWRLDRSDLYWLIALTLIGGILRFGSPIFLDIFAHPGSSAPISAWGIGHNYQDSSIGGLGKPNDIAPNSPFVFDELYFANDAHNDILGRDYFDPEPPLAKLVIAIGIKLFGFNSFGWRLMPALFGTALIPLMYLLARQLLAVRFFAIAAGVLTAFDGLTFVESRTAVIDIIPITLVVLAYLLFHLHLNADTVVRRRTMIILTGVTLGLALGAKWTTLAAYGTIIVILALRLILRWTRYDGATGGIVLLSLALLPAIFYGLSFIRYLTITHGITNLAQPALGFTPLHFSPGAAWTELAEWHRQTWLYHINLKADHIFYSPWWSWPFDVRPVVYYYAGQGLGVDQSTGSTLVAEIFNLGNPLIWWAASVSLIGIAVGLPATIQDLRSRPALDPADAARVDLAGRLDQRLYTSIFILVSFLAAWLPFAKVPRGLFLYHMLGGLPAMFLALSLALTYLRSLSGRLPGLAGRFNGAVPAYAYLVMVIGFFLYFYPLWTGLPLTADALNSHVWFAFTKPLPNWCLCYWTSPG
ncbi:MAG TPA: phospholipid carrier-dependent glycosyltransferase [Candidatus Dormibacteraeota bacterium]|nr:phospholipid carrier-dependent glycosyltransferase [Candidatus Dormibacteraeota bacterium]